MYYLTAVIQWWLKTTFDKKETTNVLTRITIPTSPSVDLILKQKHKLFGNAATVVAVVCLGGSGGFAVVFFNVFGHDIAGVCKLVDIRNVIVLSKVDPKQSPRH
ncbi:hypothetical protein V6N12_022358 [Hibiscus sabdariffa]|uniref:Transmembrane protein n=1 Tax=Hibiscus sabdariffa TaxID=183260 RepID=A0ABR2FUR9_9ROSI